MVDRTADVVVGIGEVVLDVGGLVDVVELALLMTDDELEAGWQSKPTL